MLLKDLDIVREAGGSNRALVKEFTGVRVERDLNVTLTPSANARNQGPFLAGSR